MKRELAMAIERGAARLGQGLPADAGDKLARLLLMLQHWSARINLTSVRRVDDMVGAHVLDSLALRPFLFRPRLIDVGTGAGFPGLPLAIAEPELTVELVDSNERKLAFVRQAIGQLGIANAAAVRTRAEEYAPCARFDSVTVRALAALPQIVELAGHLVGEDGVLLAMKGRYPEDEIRCFRQSEQGSSWDCVVTELAIPGLERHARHLVSLRRRTPNAS